MSRPNPSGALASPRHPRRNSRVSSRLGSENANFRVECGFPHLLAAVSASTQEVGMVRRACADPTFGHQPETGCRLTRVHLPEIVATVSSSRPAPVLPRQPLTLCQQAPAQAQRPVWRVGAPSIVATVSTARGSRSARNRCHCVNTKLGRPRPAVELLAQAIVATVSTTRPPSTNDPEGDRCHCVNALPRMALALSATVAGLALTAGARVQVSCAAPSPASELAQARGSRPFASACLQVEPRNPMS